jgi:alpha-beta hydrolase superfamily lysophospholipase
MVLKNPIRQFAPNNSEGYYYQVKDGSKIYIYDYKPIPEYKRSIFLISGITGINHNSEKNIIEQLSNNINRVVVIHPRGSGYSDGKRGDISDFSIFINDYIEIITQDKDYKTKNHSVILFGHSMSSAILLAIAENTNNIDGAILVNPAFILKPSEGMSPSFGEYLKYAWYYIFAKHKPVVNMAGNPDLIENKEDREESQIRVNDSLLVKYFSLYMMMEAKKIMDSTLEYSRKADYPLLLLYGTNDNITDKKGSDLIFKEWKCSNKQYHLIANGSHGKSTVKLAKKIINNWVNSIVIS